MSWQKPKPEPEPISALMDLKECAEKCSRCGQQIDTYPAHTHLQKGVMNVTYPCVCHKCAGAR